MKNKFIKTIVFNLVILIKSLMAQDLPVSNQYLFNTAYINPSFTGYENNLAIMLTDRHQWLNVTGAPKTQTLSVLSKLGNNNGICGVIYNDKYGAISNTGVKLFFSHHVLLSPTNQSKLLFGIGMTGFQYGINKSNLLTFEPNDPLISSLDNNKLIPEIDIGLAFAIRKIKFGVSALNLLGYSKHLSDKQDNNDQQSRFLFLYTDYLIDFIKDFNIKPLIVIKTNEKLNHQIDLSTIIYFKNSLWFGLSYRTLKTAIALIGFDYKDLKLGYAFDFTSSEIFNSSFGSHEIMISYNIRKTHKKNICPAFR